MSALGFTDQRDRLRRIVHNALDGATYRSSHEERDERFLILEASRADGTLVTVRFRGVRESEASAAPLPGSSLRVSGVGSASRFSIVGFLFPFLKRQSGAARVKIDAGTARLEVVCEDAEWWEEPGGAKSAS